MENVVEKKGIKYWVREWRHILILVLWFFFISDYCLSFLQTYLPEYLQKYSYLFIPILFINILIIVFMFDIPFFERVIKKPKVFLWANIIFLIALMIFHSIFNFEELIPETYKNPLSLIYLILTGTILFGIVIGFIKRSEQISK